MLLKDLGERLLINQEQLVQLSAVTEDEPMEIDRRLLKHWLNEILSELRQANYDLLWLDMKNATSDQVQEL
jgi:hypothetical protein